MAQWQIQAAKQRFSEVIRAVETGEPQFVTKNGREVAAIIDIEDYRRTHSKRESLAAFLLTAPNMCIDLEQLIGARTIDANRSSELFD